MAEYNNGDWVAYTQFGRDSRSAHIYVGRVVELYGDHSILINTERATECVPLGMVELLHEFTYLVSSLAYSSDDEDGRLFIQTRDSMGNELT